MNQENNPQNSPIKELFLESQRVSQIINLKSTIAHEINNPLMVIRGSLELVTKYMTDKKLKDQYIDDVYTKIQNAVIRIANIIENFRLDSKATEFEKIDVNQTILNIISEHHAILNQQNLVVDHELSEEALFTYGQPENFKWVLKHLLLNAKDSSLEVSHFGLIIIKTVATEEKIKIHVIDNGQGIPTQHLNRIFEPFFTTKTPSKAQGLGLAHCYNVITSMRGQIDAHSEEGFGAQFKITLPKAL
jgi:two-component system NtrC family sensor kinase